MSRTFQRNIPIYDAKVLSEDIYVPVKTKDELDTNIEKRDENPYLYLEEYDKEENKVEDHRGERQRALNSEVFVNQTKQKHATIEYVCCHICNKILKWKHTLKAHMLTHAPQHERPFGCGNCGKRFCKKSDLDRHITTHLIIKKRQFQCSICAKKFINKYGLDGHMLTHLPNDERAFVCNNCGFRFYRKFDLRRHQKIHAQFDDNESEKGQNAKNNPKNVNLQLNSVQINEKHLSVKQFDVHSKENEIDENPNFENPASYFNIADLYCFQNMLNGENLEEQKILKP